MARVPYVNSSDLADEYQELIVSSLQPGKTVNVYRAIGNNPEVLNGLRTFLGTLWDETGLDDHQRELVILGVANEIQSRYIWHSHVGIGRREGVTDDEILAISTGQLDEFDTDDETLLRYALAAMAGEVDDDVHDAARDRFDDETITGVAALATGYVLLGRLIDALGVELETEFVGWQLENA